MSPRTMRRLAKPMLFSAALINEAVLTYYGNMGNETLFVNAVTAGFDDMTALEVTLEGETYTFTAQGEGDGRTWSWDGREADLTGVENAAERLTAESFTDGAPEGQLEISFTAHLDSETFPEVTAELYRQDGSTCLAAVDGESVCLVDRSAVVDLMEAVRAITLGGTAENA